LVLRRIVGSMYAERNPRRARTNVMMNKNQIRTAMLASLIISCGAGSVMAQDASSSAAADKTFLMTADESNSAEIAASQLALRKSKNPEIKTYAQQMITDHEKLRTDMAPLAQQMGVVAPQPVNETHKLEAKRLAALSGKSFDAEYIKAMDQDHHKALDLFKGEIATTSNADLKAAVTQGETVIAQHTDMADQMAQKMSISTGVSTATP
jgi:putative membrane protein